MRLLLATTAALALLTGGAAQAQTGSTDVELRQAVARDYDANLGALFDDFHRNPELSGMEVRTAGIMAAQLTALGYEVTTGVGGTGVVAVLRNGDGPTVMIRADMDGLPLEEQSGLSNASTARQTDSDGIEKPVMHACGHDVHITALIGTARQMMARRQDWSGTLVLIAQPAEERIFGARAMVQDGLYTRFPKPDIALAFHVSADLATGLIDLPLGITSSSSDSVDIAVHGVGTHGAYPHLGVDPIVVASAIVMNLQTLPSRSVNPLEGAIVTVGSFHGGIKHNIISDRVDLQLTVRADNPETRLALLDGIDRVVRGTALALGVSEDRLPTVVRSPTETTPPTINDAATAARVRTAISAVMGAERLVDTPRTGMGGRGFRLVRHPRHRGQGRLFQRRRDPGGRGGDRARPPFTPVPHRPPSLGHDRRRGHGGGGAGPDAEGVRGR